MSQEELLTQLSGSDPSQLNVNFIGDIPKVLGYKVESVTVKGTIEVTLGRKEPRILSKDLHDFVMGLADVCDLGECKIHIISTNEAHVLDQHRHERIAVRQQHDGDGDAIIFQCVFFDGVMASTGEGCQHQTESNCFGYPSGPCKSVDYGRALQVPVSQSKDFFGRMHRYRSGKVPDFSAYLRLLVDPLVLDDAPLRVPAAQAAPEVVEAKPAKDRGLEWSSQTKEDHVLDTLLDRRRTKRDQQVAALLKRSATEACMNDDNPIEKKK